MSNVYQMFVFIAFAVLFALDITSTKVNGSRILLYPMAMKSHVGYFIALGDVLVKHKHDVYMVLNGDVQSPRGGVEAGIHILTYKTPDNWTATVTQQYNEFHARLIRNPAAPLSALDAILEVTRLQIEYAITDTTLLDNLKKLYFTLAIIDGLPLMQGFYLLPRRLGVPYITMVSAYFPWVLNVPALPSHVPAMTSGNSDRMTFIERLSNTAVGIFMYMHLRNSDFLTEKVRSMYGDVLADMDTGELQRRSMLWLMNVHYVVDIPRPMMPHMVNVGGIAVKSPRPLPADLQPFFDQAEKGVIIASFGSLASKLPDDINQKLLNAFKNVQQRVLWRSKVVSKDIPENVKLMEWLPQRDALAHRNTKLFITHCGNNGQLEPIYSGVPMIGFPIQPDQQYNAKRMSQRGYGILLSLSSFTSQELITAITHVLTNGTYLNNVNKAAKMVKDGIETPGDTAAYWVDHVIKYGGDHLRSYSLEMPWYQYTMLDIMAFACFIVGLLGFVAFKIFKKIFQLLL